MKRILGVAMFVVALIALAAPALAFSQLVQRQVHFIKGPNADSTNVRIAQLATGTAFDTTFAIDISDAMPTAGFFNGVTGTARPIGWLVWQNSITTSPAADSLGLYYRASNDGTNWTGWSALDAATGTSGDLVFKYPLLSTQNSKVNLTGIDGLKYVQFRLAGDTGGYFQGSLWWSYYRESAFIPYVSQ